MNMPEPAKEIGLTEAIAVTEGKLLPSFGEEDAKLLAFFLRDGECTSEISESKLSVWYSWLPRPKPSSYFTFLAPGLVSQLMQLGGVRSITDEATFQVGPGTAGIGRYVFKFERKWVRIRCEAKRIVISVRDKQEDLHKQPEHFGKVVRCERCNGELRTPLAKQCLHCGFDWH
jgi:hypothetical protein